jgi:DNA-binding MarR family transcriptional regulator
VKAHASVEAAAVDAAAVDVTAVDAAPREVARAEVETRVWRAMRALVLEQHDRRREVCEALDMSFIRAKALGLLVAGPMTMRQLAERLATDPPYTTLVVDDLQRRDLVRRSPHPSDRRLRIVTLTPAGADAAQVAERILSRPPAPVFDLNEQDLATLDRLLAKLLR